MTVAHYCGRPTFLGSRIKPVALRDKYNNISAENFGTTTVKIVQANGSARKYKVRDMHYSLGNGMVGMNILPSRDNAYVRHPDNGVRVPGHAPLDDFLRKEMSLGPDDQIFALGSFIHPEDHRCDVRKLTSQSTKPEMSTTHMAAYWGGGVTTNAPEDYHNSMWGNSGYPAQISIVSLKGVLQAELNKNAKLVDGILNQGVRFPDGDYKNKVFRTIDLNANLQFYRDWLNGEEYLKSDNSWRTTCSDHKTTMVNVMLNVPHNQKSFEEIFQDEGSLLWDIFTQRFRELNRRDFTHNDETHFIPLWKLEGLTPAEIRPMTKTEYDRYEVARYDGSVANGSYTGFRPLAPGFALAWVPETTADLVNEFMETYAPFRKAGGYAASATLLGLIDSVTERMGITREQYLQLVIPFISKLMIAEAMAMAPEDPTRLSAWMRQAKFWLSVLFREQKVVLPEGYKHFLKLAETSIQGVATASADIARVAMQSQCQRREAAVMWLHENKQADLAKARAQAVASPDHVEHYSPPAILTRVASGLCEVNRFVTIRMVATVMDARELEGQDDE